MSKFKLTQTAAEVQDILNNSLQKPTGLAKTKLVGVGVNGQENIEIGDNLTLANGKLSAATGGGSARHCYFVDVDRQFIYIVNTEKNYNFTIGEENLVSNFTSNNYEELRTEGSHIATGYYNGSKGEQRIVRSFTLYSNKHSGFVTGTSLNPNITTSSSSIDLSSTDKPIVVVQLY